MNICSTQELKESFEEKGKYIDFHVAVSDQGYKTIMGRWVNTDFLRRKTNGVDSCSNYPSIDNELEYNMLIDLLRFSNTAHAY